jgi:hypothetical protein
VKASVAPCYLGAVVGFQFYGRAFVALFGVDPVDDAIALEPVPPMWVGPNGAVSEFFRAPKNHRVWMVLCDPRFHPVVEIRDGIEDGATNATARRTLAFTDLLG